MDILLRPKKLHGVLDAVPSKSITHRLIIASALACGVSYIDNPLNSTDIAKTIECCKDLGATIEKTATGLKITGLGYVKRVKENVYCGESGSTIRFMIPIMLTNSEKITFWGEHNLVKRPLDDFFAIFEKQNISYSRPANAYLPLTTKGALQSGAFAISGNVSSQFLTGLLMALPLLEGDSTIELVTPLESKGYIDLTLDVLNKAKIIIEHNDNYTFFRIKGNQKYQPLNETVEADFSTAAFFLTANALGNDVYLKGLNLSSKQGDRGIIDHLEQFGAEVVIKDQGLKLVAKELKPSIINLADTPDLGPILGMLAGYIKGTTTFININRLRIKESDRVLAIVTELAKLGIDAKDSISENKLVIHGKGYLQSTNDAISHNDHRIAMAIAIASTVAEGPILLKQAESVAKSYPTFWDDFKKVGGDFDVLD